MTKAEKIKLLKNKANDAGIDFPTVIEHVKLGVYNIDEAVYTDILENLYKPSF